MSVSPSPSIPNQGSGNGVVARFSDHLEPLDREQCLLRLRARGVGRVGIVLHGRPLIYPVNYFLAEDCIIIRTRPRGDIALGTDNALVAFEIDGADNFYHEGWSVLVVGRANHVSDPDRLKDLTRLPLTPWAGNDRWCVVTVALDEVSGRHLHHRVAASLTLATHVVAAKKDSTSRRGTGWRIGEC